MGDDQGGVTLPANMTEEEVIEIVRELLGDDEMSDGELMAAYRSGMFQELCPDIAQYAKQKRPPKGGAAESPEVEVIPRPPAAKVKKELILISDSDSGHESRNSHHKKKKKKKHKHHKEHKDRDQKDKDHHHKDHKDVKREREENGGTSKAETSSAGHSSSKDVKRERDKSPDRSIKKEVKRERDKTPDRSIKKEKDKEPKPFSKYNSSQSHIKIRRWMPVMDREHVRHEKKLGLEPLSIVCLDLLDLPMLFHHPEKKAKNSNSTPLTSNLLLDQNQRDVIRRLERDKLNWFKGKLTRRALKLLRPNVKRERRLSSSDEDTSKKKKRVRIRTMSTSSSSGASSSDVMVPIKKPKVENDRMDRGGAKLSKAEREAEAKKRKLEEIRKKAHKVSKHGTRVLAWENKDEYFKGGKKKAEDLAKERVKAEKKKKAELKEKLEKQKKKNAPTVSFQRILAQIDAANKEEAKKPTVQLKIPKISQRPAAEYRLERKINVGDVAKEVERLLKSNVKVEMPVMPDNSEDLGEYTVKKIAWWVLKTEKDPPEFGVCHPEMHDEDDLESNHSGDFDWPSDMSSIHGCVSDPEGLASEMPPDKTKVNDPDWADDYCGEASLYGKMRYHHKDVTNLESMDAFKSFLRIKPGTNYAKSNFEAKCFICNELCKGQRQLGAHIRSHSHKNNFRNYTLNMVSCEENIEKGVPQKMFAAKLVEYSVNQGSSNAEKPTDVSEAKKHHVGKIERARSDSPGPIIAGDTAANIQVHEMPIPDDISLPSIEDYDISSDESLQNVKVHIRTTGRWNESLEKRWRTWQDEEAKIAEVYNVERERYINEPERHPAYQEEWMNFWEKRCTELEAEGKDTDTYDFQKEWMPFWLKRMQEIMKERVERQVRELKQSYQIDKFTLRLLYNVPVDETRRKNVKKKVGKIEIGNSSSLKSSAKVESSVPSIQQMVPASHQKHQSQYNRDSHRQHHSSSHHQRSNDMHKRPVDDRRDKYSSGGNREQFGRSCDTKQTLKIMDESNIRGTQALENISPSNSDIGDQPNQALKSIKSVCSNISSAEPLPPVVDKFPGPQNPFLSKAQINEMKEKTSRDLNELKFKHEHNRRPDDKNPSNNRTSKSNKHIDRNDGGGSSRRNDNCDKSKHSSDNRQGDDSNKSWKGRRESDNSTASDNVRMTHSSIQELREAISNEESISGTNTKSSARPKIRTIEATQGKRLEDGEVGSDVSSLDDFNPGFKGVSTFINKSIPGLGEASISADNLNKNSLGYHLLERRKSIDQQGASHSARPQSEKDRHDSSKGHSSKDKNRQKHDYRGPPDARNQIRKNSQDGRPGDHHPPRDNFHRNKKGKGNHNEKWNRRNKKQGNHHHNQGFRNNNSNPSTFNNNSNTNVPPRVQEASWEQEESWESTTAENPWAPQRTTPQSPAVLNSAATVPEWGNQIPVISATREPQGYIPGQPYQPNHWQTPQQQWDSNFPPQPTDPNNFYR